MTQFFKRNEMEIPETENWTTMDEVKFIDQMAESAQQSHRHFTNFLTYLDNLTIRRWDPTVDQRAVVRYATAKLDDMIALEESGC